MNLRACNTVCGAALGLWVSGGLAGCGKSGHVLGEDAGQQQTAGAPSDSAFGGGSAVALGGRQASNTGGAPSTGGASITAGAPNTGGSSSTGDAPNTGGASSTAGASNTGGAPGAGGASSTAGASNTGGAPATAGASNTGGALGGGGTASSGAGGTSSTDPQGGSVGAGPEPPICTNTLTDLDTTCTLEQVCEAAGCGTLSGELDQCGNPRQSCSSNADCQANELCTPLVAWAAGKGCGVATVSEDCDSVVIYQCAMSGPFCTVAEGLPEPCTSDVGDIEFAHMVETLCGQVPSAMTPEIRLPLLLCVERFHDSHPPAPYGTICSRQPNCDDACADECERWYTADSGAAYDKIISILLNGELELTTTPLARAMEELPQ